MFGRQERLEYSGEDAPKSRRWLWITLIVLAIIVVGFFTMGKFMSGQQDGGATKAATKSGGNQSQMPTVTVTVPGRQAVQTVISGTGSLAAKREMPVGVA
ncbi:MAG TPA: efflux RND transporter periplasmic adaptor subunit, partial [Sphingomonas sp.]|nr:efflux RND transporter periplasmic adaptor subunit [Sphingomonas sp.]